MKQSKFIFIILAVIYVTMAIASPFKILRISENLLFALSVSALLISMSDVINKACDYMCAQNAFNANMRIAIDFLDGKISAGYIPSRCINVRNVRENYNSFLKKDYVFCHPSEYVKKPWIRVLSEISFILFVLGIAAFIIIPFLAIELVNGVVTTIVTFSAFAAMALGLFFDELIGEKNADINALMNEKHLIIYAEYPDFRTYYEMHMNYINDLLSIEKMKNESCAEKNRSEDNDAS
ncbi:hypothetical protein SAMN02910301_0414 [Lachnospiraceae bacterium XBD2001]|nr:hypothetical protein SAMN02910301_0414 [Lachnospiraceae bacterium XBD2001]